MELYKKSKLTHTHTRTRATRAPTPPLDHRGEGDPATSTPPPWTRGQGPLCPPRLFVCAVSELGTLTQLFRRSTSLPKPLGTQAGTGCPCRTDLCRRRVVVSRPLLRPLDNCPGVEEVDRSPEGATWGLPEGTRRDRLQTTRVPRGSW